MVDEQPVLTPEQVAEIEQTPDGTVVMVTVACTVEDGELRLPCGESLAAEDADDPVWDMTTWRPGP
jgi:hypothetical protein